MFYFFCFFPTVLLYEYIVVFDPEKRCVEMTSVQRRRSRDTKTRGGGRISVPRETLARTGSCLTRVMCPRRRRPRNICDAVAAAARRDAARKWAEERRGTILATRDACIPSTTIIIITSARFSSSSSSSSARRALNCHVQHPLADRANCTKGFSMVFHIPRVTRGRWFSRTSLTRRTSVRCTPPRKLRCF